VSAPTRRDLLAGGGLVVFFTLAGPALAQTAQNRSGGGEGAGGPKKVRPDLPGSLSTQPILDAWIRIAPNGHATVFTGKAELGQGIKTALVQIATDELDLPTKTVTLVTADTGRTPDEGVTAGSHSMQDSGTAIANAAANVRHLLAGEAARRWGVPMDTLFTQAGMVRAPDGRSLGYGALAATLDLHVAAVAGVPRKPPGSRHFIGTEARRIDIPAKLTGGVAYVHDMVLPDMLHARVVRGPSDGTRLIAPDLSGVSRLPGVGMVRDGNFTALVGPREWPLIRAWRTLNRAKWERTTPPLPQGDLSRAIQALPSQDKVILDRHDDPAAVAVRRLAARYTRPYLMHASIGPSCALALYQGGTMTVWTHSQGVYPLRKALADLLRMPIERIRCIHAEGAGCYGHNGADDVAADAALAARAVPGRPVRLLWMREQEHGWEPLGPAMVTELSGALDANGRIVGWRHEVWSNTHTTRPVQGGDLLAGQEVVPPMPVTPPVNMPQPEGGGDRNIVPLYALPNMTLVKHFLPDMPLRVSALRGLGAHVNVFSLESFMDELAGAAGRDPVAFRLAHLQDERAAAVIREAAARFGWTTYQATPTRGAGFAFARYKNLGAFCAVALDVEVDSDTGQATIHRAVAAVDSGDVVNPNGIRNQIEGGIVQALSWTQHEAVGFDATRRISFDWSEYPIARFVDVPRSVQVHVLNRIDQPYLGTGEAAQGPTAAAFANAVARITGRRIRDMPLTASVLKSPV
jgi:CO/xanthine dehydrogenase Mo-binding subunit